MTQELADLFRLTLPIPFKKQAHTRSQSEQSSRLRKRNLLSASGTVPYNMTALAVDHLRLVCDDGSQDFLLFALRHVEVVQCSGDLCSHLVELFGRDVEVFVRFVQVLARVLEGSTGHLAQPECPHEFKAWQLARLVPFLQGRVYIEFRILDDFVAEAVNDHGDGVDAPDPFVKTLLCHLEIPSKDRYSSREPTIMGPPEGDTRK